MLKNLHGVAVSGSDPIYARAALMQDDGRATLDPDLLTSAARRVKRGDDSLDVILVAGDPAQALLTRLPNGLTLTGIVAERSLSFTPPDDLTIALIVDVEQAREQIGEGNLLIMDPERGQILVEPDAEEFARLQAERGQRPRVLIASPHTPARTQGGRLVSVWASVRSHADVAAALEAGADGLLITLGGDIISDEEVVSEDEALRPLLDAASAFGGGDMALRIPFDSLNAATVVQLAARCRLRWVIDADDLPLPLVFFREQLDELVSEENRERRLAAMPILAAFVPAPERMDDAGDFAELFLTPAAAESLGVADTFDLPPFYVILDADGAALPHAVLVGARGVIVPPPDVASTKDFIRAQEY